MLYWGFIVTFTKLLTIYHSWTHSLHYSFYSPFPYSWNSFNRSHFSIFIHSGNIFTVNKYFSAQANTLVIVLVCLCKSENDYMLEKKIIQIHLLFAGWILDNSTKDLKFAFTNLTPFTMYDVYVAAETSAGTGPKSNLSVFTPPEGKNVSFRELIIYF
jgi:hypothetical protein